jgi:hypothetical protein
MKTAGIFVFALSLLLMGSSFQADKKSNAFQTQKVAKYEDCFTVTLRTKGVYLSTDPNCIEIHWRNDCTVRMDLKYAFEQIGGGWVIGSRDAIAPQEEVGSQCINGTGTCRIWARPTSENKTIQFPTNEEILNGTAK